MSILEIVIPTILFMAIVALRAEGMSGKYSKLFIKQWIVISQEESSWTQCSWTRQLMIKKFILFTFAKLWQQQQQMDRKQTFDCLEYTEHFIFVIQATQLHPCVLSRDWRDSKDHERSWIFC